MISDIPNFVVPFAVVAGTLLAWLPMTRWERKYPTLFQLRLALAVLCNVWAVVLLALDLFRLPINILLVRWGLF